MGLNVLLLDARRRNRHWNGLRAELWFSKNTLGIRL